MIGVSDSIKIAQFVIAGAQKAIGETGIGPSQLELAIMRHMTFLSNWSSQTEVGLNEFSSISTSESTIALGFSLGISKFRIHHDNSTSDELVSEAEILRLPTSIVIAGQPGAGKTTTLRRLVRTMLHPEMMNFQVDDIQHNVPFLVRCRSMAADSIVEEIAVTFGFPIDKETSASKGNRVGRPTVASVPLDQVVSKFLDEIDAVLFVDGVDEAPAHLQEALLGELSHLSQSLHSAKIISTCRSGSIVRPLEGLVMLEIDPISRSEAISIAKGCIEDWENFAVEIQKVNYQELFDRPLFLLLALIIYSETGTLPNRGMHLHERVINICLEGWDSKRGIKRDTKYSRFLTEEKKLFLSELAAYLFLQDVPLRVFTDSELYDFYKISSSRFNLPQNEAEGVISEIRSHSGIIMETSSVSHEFSHQSIQEYLAAFHLIRQSSPRQLKRIYDELPELAALLVTLASEPEAYLVDIFCLILCEDNGFLKKLFRQKSEFDGRNAQVFLSRLCTEKPSFRASSATGLAFIALFTNKRAKGVLTKELVEKISIIPNVKRSVQFAIREWGGHLDSNRNLTFSLSSETRKEIKSEHKSKLERLLKASERTFVPGFKERFVDRALLDDIRARRK